MHALAKFFDLIFLFVCLFIHRPALSREHARPSSKCGYHGHPNFGAYKDYLGMFMSIPSNQTSNTLNPSKPEPKSLKSIPNCDPQSSMSVIKHFDRTACVGGERRWFRLLPAIQVFFCVSICLSHRGTMSLKCVPCVDPPEHCIARI